MDKKAQFFLEDCLFFTNFTFVIYKTTTYEEVSTFDIRTSMRH